MSHPANTAVLENMRVDKEFYEQRAREYKAQGNKEAVDLARKLAQKITDRAHRIEGYIPYQPTI